MLRELQENRDKQFNNIRNTIQEDEKFTKEKENIKQTNKQTIFVTKPKNAIMSFNSRLDQVEEIISKLK